MDEAEVYFSPALPIDMAQHIFACLSIQTTRVVGLFLLLVSSVVAQSPHIVTDAPLTPEQQRSKFRLPPGFEIQLVAAEPEIRKPINLAFDTAGRLYATGSIEYPFAAADPAQARDTVQRFTIGHDGRATQVETVVSGLNIPIGIAPHEGELFVYSIPQVLRCRDRNGDGVFEEKRPVVEGFGFRDTHGMVNNITPWIDGWIYTCHGFSNESQATGVDGSQIALQSGNTFRWRPDGTRVEYFTHGQVNPFGMAFDPLGNLFSADCHTLPAYQLLRGAWYPSFGKPHDGLGFGPTMMRHQHGSTGIAGIVYYAATQFPSDYRGSLYIGNPITARVNRDRVVWHGSTPEAVEQPDFVTCDDRWFRPVDVKLGPDGALYIADFYNCIIGHYEVPLDHPQRDRERGRIWRVVYRGPDATAATPTDLTKLAPSALLELLADPNLAMRMLVVQELNRRQEPSLDASLRQVVQSSTNSDQRVAAMWLLERHGLAIAHEPQLLDHDDRLLRVHALKALAERESTTIDTPLRERVLQLLNDGDPVVRRAAVDCLGRHPDRQQLRPLLQAWRQCPTSDTHLLHAIRLAVREQLRLPGQYEALQLSELEEPLVLEVSLGLATAESASFVAQRIATDSVPNGLLGPSVEHALRYSNPAALARVLERLKRFELAPLDQQVLVIRSASKALSSRGEALSPAFRAWQLGLIQQLLDADREAQVQLGLEIAREFKPASLIDRLETWTRPDSRYANLRPLAIDACVATDAARAIPLCSTLLAATNDALGVRQKAAQALGSLPQEAARAVLVEQLRFAPERLAIEIAAALAPQPIGAELLLKAIESGKASAWLLQEPTVLRNLNRAKLPQLSERVAQLTAALPARDDRLTRLINERRTEFGTHGSNLARGQAVFKKICANCHRLTGEGQKVGPELDGIGLRGPERLLENVLDPSRAVDEAFRATQITTRDGRSLTGLAQRREGEVQILIDMAGKELRVPVSDIEEQQRLTLSPMPANVADLLPAAEFYDLLAYLLDQRQKLPIGR